TDMQAALEQVRLAKRIVIAVTQDGRSSYLSRAESTMRNLVRKMERLVGTEEELLRETVGFCLALGIEGMLPVAKEFILKNGNAEMERDQEGKIGKSMVDWEMAEVLAVSIIYLHF